MALQFKPDFDQAREAWNHYWAREKWKRPLVAPNAIPKYPDQKTENPWTNRYYHAVRGEHRQVIEKMTPWFENYRYLAEAMPHFGADFGPDQFAAILGTTLHFLPDSFATNWVEPFVEEWDGILPLKPDENSLTWKSLLSFTRMLAEDARGRYLVSICDLHSNADALSAIRGPEKLCMDFYDRPELIERAMHDVRRMYQPVYNRLYEAAGYDRNIGTYTWAFWCEGKIATIQCDFICLVSPEISRRYIIPALEEEAGFLDHCVMHLDGPGALPHLDDILAIKKIDVIQWVSGDGQPRMWEPAWRDVLARCQKAGKGLQIYDLNIEEAKQLHRQLDPAGVVYCVEARNAKEVDDFCHWLEKNS